VLNCAKPARVFSKFCSSRKNKFEFFLATSLRVGITSQHDGVIEPRWIDQSLNDHFALIERPFSANKIFYNRIKQNKKNSTGAMS
jgi:hypothetical protein